MNNDAVENIKLNDPNVQEMFATLARLMRHLLQALQGKEPITPKNRKKLCGLLRQIEGCNNSLRQTMQQKEQSAESAQVELDQLRTDLRRVIITYTQATGEPLATGIFSHSASNAF